MRRLSHFAALSVVALLLFVPTAGAHNRDEVTVSIRDFFFNPAQIVVKPGTTVVWVNDGNASHTVTAFDRSVDSETLLPGDTFAVRFNGSGTFWYFCEIHPRMRGSVKVVRDNKARSFAEARAGGAVARARGS